MPKSLQRLYRLHGASLVAALRKRFGEGPPDPEDAAHAAIIKYIELNADTEVASPRAFLFAMARNLMVDELRRMDVRHRHVEHEECNPLVARVEEITPENVLLNRERRTRLNEAVRALPERQRRLIVMSRIDGLSYKQIAERTGLSQAGISREITRALAALQAQLTDGGGLS